MTPIDKIYELLERYDECAKANTKAGRVVTQNWEQQMLVALARWATEVDRRHSDEDTRALEDSER